MSKQTTPISADQAVQELYGGWAEDPPAGNRPDPPSEAAPELRDVARRLWSALDKVRSRDARWLGPELRALHTELGAALRRAAGDE